MSAEGALDDPAIFAKAIAQVGASHQFYSGSSP
jgi:hypothetical protein